MATDTVTGPSSRSTISTISRPKLATVRPSDAHRSRLLNRIGIFNAPNSTPPNPAIERKMKIIRAMGLGGVIPPKPQSHDSTTAGDNENIRPKIDFSKVTHEPLKYEELEFNGSDYHSSSQHSHLHQSSKSGSGSSTIPSTAKLTATNSKNGPKPKTKQRKAKITFNDDVSVAHIPMRSEYSERVRSRLWSNRYEIHENATRNAIEFQAEGWDWRSVTEDEGMFVCTSSGELIHPVHCQQ